MEKTVRVIDRQGNLLEATYPKRAKGLVKHGRARFVDEQTICLTCPPNRSLEETKMSEEYKETFTLNPAEILKRIDEIQRDNAYIMQALETLEKIPSNYSDNPGAPEDVAGKAKAEAIVEIVHDRTEFNQKLLDFYITLFERATQQ
ncbi:MAG TPA: hypothetical protein IAB55_12090 [Candidatus Merdivicinus faecavium]|nr:hypothetical protein [Candidatus Merdivicinus faecavium]